ncbi:hypothetical protein C8Q74DRAFT_1370548 [Fomes fomentarius]|nr:hypothetical protein C8Q74DRAFT_1370548 [Fomes fomentarius]
MPADSDSDYGEMITWNSQLEAHLLEVEEKHKQEEERKKAAQRREAEDNGAEATQTEANVEQASLADLDHSTNDGQPLVADTDPTQEVIASQSAGGNPDPAFEAVQVGSHRRDPTALREQVVSWLPQALRSTGGQERMELSSYKLQVIDGGVIEDIPITLGGLWCVDQATAPNLSRGQWFYMGRLIQRVQICGRLVAFDFSAGCVYLELEDEDKRRCHVHHFINKTSAHVPVLPGVFLKATAWLEIQYRWSQKCIVLITDTVPTVLNADELTAMVGMAYSMRIVLRKLAIRWRVWWLEYGLREAVRGVGYVSVPWDPSPLDFKVEEAYQPAGQRILNETLDRFRDGECYMGADALEVVWVARAALHEEGIFNVKVISQIGG